MNTLYKLLIPATLLFGLQQCNQAAHDVNEIFAVFKAGAPFLTYLSSDWSYDTLDQALDPDALKGNEDQYRYMLERVSKLGKWKHTCEKVDKQSLGHSWEVKKISLKSICQFENGDAEVTFVAYDKPKFVGFKIEKVYRAQKI